VNLPLLILRQISKREHTGAESEFSQQTHQTEKHTR
jgi:hypothetical protein